METLLLATKLFGLIAASGIGVFSITHDYRDKTTGRLTLFGRSAIVILVISALSALTAQFIEEELKNKSAREASIQAAASAARSEMVINDLARVLQPLEFKSVYISEIAVPLDDFRFSLLRRSIDEISKDYQNRTQKVKSSRATQKVSAPSMDCKTRQGKCVPMAVEITPQHPAFPRSGLEAAAFRVGSVFIALYRKPILPAQFEQYIVGAPNEADLSFFSGSMEGSESLSIKKYLVDKRYTLSGLFTKMYMKNDTSGRILGVPDLAGSQIFLRLPANALPDDMASYDFGVRLPKSARIKRSEVIEIQQKFELGAVAFHIGARTMWVPKKAWRKYVTKTAVYWEYIIPPDPFKIDLDEKSREIKPLQGKIR